MSEADTIKNYFDQNFQAALQYVDLNHDGYVDENELIQVLQRACVPYWTAVTYARQIIASHDKTHDGRLSVADAQSGCCQTVNQNCMSLVDYLKRLFREQPQQAFYYYNTNGDCWLTQGEIINVLTRAGVGCYEASLAVRQLFCEFDRDRNGVLSLRELTGCC